MRGWRMVSLFNSSRSGRRYAACPMKMTMFVFLIVYAALSSRALAEPSAKPSLMIMPFDLTNYAMDQRPGVVQDLQRWVSALPGEIQKDLNGKSEFVIHTSHGLQSAYHSLAEQYQHPMQCRSCVLALGKKAHVKYVLIGQVNKVSTLLVFCDLQIVDVKNGKTVAVIDLRSDGAINKPMWTHIAQNMAYRIQQVRIP